MAQTPESEPVQPEPTLQERQIAELTRVAADASAREAEYRAQIEALKAVKAGLEAEIEALEDDFHGALDHLHADFDAVRASAVAHATEVIRLAGIIAETPTKELRQWAQRFVDGIRQLAG